MFWADIFILSILSFFVIRTCLSHFLTWGRWTKRKKTTPLDTTLPPISIIKPVRGLDQEAEENFRSFIQAPYPAPFEVLFCVEDKDDPAVPLIQRLIAERSAAKVHLTFSRRQDQRELGKTINLMAGIKESSHEVLVLSDSDVRNSPGFLDELVRPLTDPKIGLTYACPVYRGAANWPAGLMALAVNETILALSAAPRYTAIGSTIATRKDVLRAIGGIGRLRHRIGVDAALGRAVYAKGYRIELIKQPVAVMCRTSTTKGCWEQLHRWLVTIRCYLGPGYHLFFLYGFPLPWATLYLLLSLFAGKELQGLAIWSTILFVRLASIALVNLLYAKEPAVWRYLWLTPLLDFLKVPLWAEAYINPYVIWRGRKYRVMPDATVRPVV